jgi:hypothetical protein
MQKGTFRPYIIMFLVSAISMMNILRTSKMSSLTVAIPPDHLTLALLGTSLWRTTLG